MVSFRSAASRSASLSAPRHDAAATPSAAGPERRADRAAPEGAADRTIRRDFDALAARIRILQAQIQREAASLHAR